MLAGSPYRTLTASAGTRSGRQSFTRGGSVTIYAAFDARSTKGPPEGPDDGESWRPCQSWKGAESTVTAYRTFLLEQIEAGTQAVQGLVRHLPADRGDCRPAPERWSARENLNHLRNVERRYLERLEGVLAEGEYVPPTKPDVEPADASESLSAILEQFVALRGRELALFRRLSPAQWEHGFDHPTLWGVISVEFWAERIITHCSEHVQALWLSRQLSAIQPERLRRLARPIDRAC